MDSEARFESLADNIIQSVNVGDDIYFGNGQTLLWQVLSVEPEWKRILIMTEDCLDEKMTYGYGNRYTTWKDSQIREYLNDRFFYETFYCDESYLIEQVELEETKIVPGYQEGVGQIEFTGETTLDKVFVLSVDRKSVV